MADSHSADDVARLREANEELKQGIDDHLNGASSPAPCADELHELRAENVRLREVLLRYKAVEEEIAAQRVFQKAKKMLIAWLTIGGSIVTLASVLGLVEFDKYTKQLVDDKLKTITEEKIDKTIEDEGEKEVAKLIGQRQQAFEDYAHQQIQQFVAVMPIGKFPSTAATTTLPDATVSEIDYTARI